MKILLIACRVLWREFSFFASQSENVIEYCFLPQGLHLTPDKLREEVQSAIDGSKDQCFDAIILGYGLCSNGIEGIKARDAKLVIPRAHDCITLLLGSKERYKEHADANPSSYWYSPGWIDSGTQPSAQRVELTRKFYVEKYGEDNAEYLMETMENWMVSYDTAAYVDLGVGGREGYLEYTRKCAEEMGWTVEELDGDPGLVRDLVSGKWTGDRFLVVEPGEEVATSFDENIIRANLKSG